jgi:hypothetical protein
MKYINTKELTDDQYQDLSNLIENRLVVCDQMEMQAEYDVENLKIDEDGVVYAPTTAFTYEESDNGENMPAEGLREVFTELKGYEPIYKILIKQ